MAALLKTREARLIAYYRDCAASEGGESPGAADLLAELDKLASWPAAQLRSGPLGTVLGLHAPPRREPRTQFTPVPLIVASNLSQDRAVTGALHAPFTVVTGPPGTGKSQVLVNTAAAAVAAGQSVLFASRTNRAVDVVFERLALIGGGVPLRAGRAALRTSAAEAILGELARPSARPSDPAARREWLALAAGLAPLYAQATERARLQLALVAALGDGRERDADRFVRRLRRLPPDAALRTRLDGYQARRLAVGRRMWNDRWSRLAVSAPPEARMASAAVASILERSRPVTTRGAASTYRRCLAAFPVWGVTNLALAACLPLEGGLFDIVIVDEASQCDVASALPLLARARRALVIGDRQQLRHVSRLTDERQRAIASAHRFDEGQLGPHNYRSRSLFELACVLTGEAAILLDEHYRCHPEVIGFSNRHLYAGRLIVRTRPDAGGGVTWRHVRGAFERGLGGRGACNPPEARAAVDALAEIWARREQRTIGVVTPFRAQAELILRQASTRLSPAAFAGGAITVDTVYRFQGDERDVMILSPVVSSALPPFLVRVAGDPRLTNVAVTRARLRLIIVGDRDACLEAGGILAELADYAALAESPFPQ